ncbi:MAG: SPOR domain-containing protein [Gemmatimonadaceae bacterium]|nr:SPOR domain-containing protein [Gemmatimonadaceae bacterium]
MTIAWRGLLVCALAAAGERLMAQEIAPGLPAPVFRGIERARLADANGEHERARWTLDSLVAQLPGGSEAMGEVLFWRATLASDGMDAERDYRRLIVEHPVSSRTEEALFRLAELDVVRGNGDRARGYLQRLWRDHTAPASQARTAYWLAVSWFDAQELTRACSALAEARTRVPSGDGALDRAIANAWPRCASVPSARRGASVDAVLGADSARATPVAAPAGVVSAPRSVAEGVSAVKGAVAPPATVRYSVQLAATETRAEAEAMVRRLSTRGIAARVDGTAAPFRVRVGHHATWSEANAQLRTLKASGLTGFVADVPGPTP